MTTESERPRIPGGPVKFEPDFLRLVQEMPAGPIKVVTAIPWCTTHDSTMIPDEPGCDLRYDAKPCALSRGGPDHKWWRDTE